MFDFLKKNILLVLCAIASLMCHAGLLAAGILLCMDLASDRNQSLPLGPHLTAQISFIPTTASDTPTDKSAPTESLHQKPTKVQKKQKQGSSYPTHESHNDDVVAHITPQQNNPKPPYPFAAREKGLEATCMMHLHLDQNGAVSSVTLSKDGSENCLPCFQKSAEQTLVKWRFNIPHSSSSQHFEQQIPITFKLIE